MSNEIEVLSILDKFCNLAKNSSKSHPFIVIFLMHEYFRNIWPNDPFIVKEEHEDKLESISYCLENLIEFLSSSKKMGSYFEIEEKFDTFNQIENKSEGFTQTVYGKLWKSLDSTYLLNETQEILKNLLIEGGIDIE